MKRLARRLPGPLRHAVRIARDVALFSRGYARLILRQQPDEAAGHALRRLFCLTNGRLNDAVSVAHRLLRRPYAVDTHASLIPAVRDGGIASIVQALDRDGYYVFADPVPEDLCAGLEACGRETPCTVIGLDEQPRPERVRFDPTQPVGVMYDADPQGVLECPAAQRLSADPGLLAIAQAYFRGKAVLELVSLWWSLPGATASSEAAQLYHFDMDRVKFLKFFVCVTDVGAQNGPHCYIAGSHRRLPRAIRIDGRQSDESIHAQYAPERRIEITGRRGTLFAVDTRGLHKGKRVVAGQRLMFQVQFSIDLFGVGTPRIQVNDRFGPEFRAAAQRYPYTFSDYAPTRANAGRRLNAG